MWGTLWAWGWYPWSPASTCSSRSFFLRLCSEVPILEDTLMRILVIGLSRELPLGPADAMELADHLVKRAAAVQADGEGPSRLCLGTSCVAPWPPMAGLCCPHPCRSPPGTHMHALGLLRWACLQASSQVSAPSHSPMLTGLWNWGGGSRLVCPAVIQGLFLELTLGLADILCVMNYGRCYVCPSEGPPWPS